MQSSTEQNHSNGAWPSDACCVGGDSDQGVTLKLLNCDVLREIFSLLEPHTQWISKGKAGGPVELGRKLLITTDQNHS